MVKTGQEIEGIVKQYISSLNGMNIRVEHLILYGSYAKGYAREESDIDLLVVSGDFEGMNLRERLEVLGVAAARIRQPIQAKGYTPLEMESEEKDSFLLEVLADSKMAA